MLKTYTHTKLATAEGIELKSLIVRVRHLTAELFSTAGHCKFEVQQ